MNNKTQRTKKAGGPDHRGNSEKAQRYSMIKEIISVVKWAVIVIPICIAAVKIAPFAAKFAGVTSSATADLNASLSATGELTANVVIDPKVPNSEGTESDGEPKEGKSSPKEAGKKPLYYSVMEYALYGIILIGGWFGYIYGSVEKWLRGRKVDQLSSHTSKIEKQIDPKKQSSGLHKTGQTNPEDIK